MIKTIVHWLLLTLALLFTAHLIEGIQIECFSAAFIAVGIIKLVDVFIKPIIMFLSLPVNLLTLGLFSLVINILLFMLAAHWTPGFFVGGFVPATAGIIIFSILGLIIKTALDK